MAERLHGPTHRDPAFIAVPTRKNKGLGGVAFLRSIRVKSVNLSLSRKGGEVHLSEIDFRQPQTEGVER
jgi:hypothetical protein